MTSLGIEGGVGKVSAELRRKGSPGEGGTLDGDPFFGGEGQRSSWGSFSCWPITALRSFWLSFSALFSSGGPDNEDLKGLLLFPEG